METKAATILDYDAASGEGVARVAGGGPDVRFHVSACRGVTPSKHAQIRVGLLGPDKDDVFAPRAALVERTSEWPELPIVHTVGITAPERRADGRGKELALVPFDPTAFEAVKNAYPEELVATLTFGAASPAPARVLPAHLALLEGALRPVARTALALTASAGEPPLGGSFVAGDIADIGDAPWPIHAKKPMQPLLQIGLAEARRLGLDGQVNAFVATKPRSTSNTVVKVMLGAPGARRVGKQSLGEPLVIGGAREVYVYPGIVGLQSAYKLTQGTLPLDLRRLWEVQAIVGKDRELMSIQCEIEEQFARADDVDADVVLGGFSSMMTQGEPPLRRLAALSITGLSWLKGFPKHQRKVILEVSADVTSVAYLR